MKFIRSSFVQLSFLTVLALGVSSQTPSSEEGLKAYSTGNYLESIRLFNEVTKQNPSNADGWYRLGLSYFAIGKLKDAAKTLEKAVKLQPANSDLQAFLAYVYVFDWDRRSEKIAKSVLQVNKSNSHANFVMAVLALRGHEYGESVDFARVALGTASSLRFARRVKSQALVALFASEPYPPKRSPEARIALLDEAVSDLEKYLVAENSSPAKAEFEDYLESIRFFANYYRIPGKLNSPGERDVPDPNAENLRITKKTAPAYTDSARNAGVEGTSTLIVEFRSNGKIGHIVVAIPLEDSLDMAAIEAAKKIKFVPRSKNGLPISVVRRI